MARANISELRADLSRYLARVERGETVVVCRRDVPIAEIRPLDRAPAENEERPIGIDRGMTVPDSIFDPLPAELLRPLGGR